MNDKIMVIEALSDESKINYRPSIVLFYLEIQKEIKESVLNKEINQCKNLKNKIINFYRDILLELDKKICLIELDDLNIREVGESVGIKQQVIDGNSRIRGLKKTITINEVDAGYYLNNKSIEFTTKIKNLDEFLSSSFNKTDFVLLLIEELKKNKQLCICKENKEEIYKIINQLKRRKIEVLKVMELINESESDNLKYLNKIISEGEEIE
ncbi:MAG: hypothetical protein ACRCW9_06295 [Cetobacterium sp.]